MVNIDAPQHRAPPEAARDRLAGVEWAVSTTPVPYEQAVAVMENRVAAIARGDMAELVWLLEHPALYTAGTSAREEDLLAPDRFPVHRTGRGGQYTYHGPGQRIVYVMLDVRKRTGDVRTFVGLLERWVIEALARLGVVGETRPDRVGVWTKRPERGRDCEDKIAAIGIRVRRWVSFHGISINVSPDLEHFSGIIPCGVSEYGVTSLADLGIAGATMAHLDQQLREAFETGVGKIAEEVSPPLQAAITDYD